MSRMYIRHRKRISAERAQNIENSKLWPKKLPQSMLWGDIDEVESKTWKDESCW